MPLAASVSAIAIAGGDRELGVDPETGQPVQLKIGRFGPYVEITPPEGDKPKRSSLPKGWSPACRPTSTTPRTFTIRRIACSPSA